MLGPPAISTPSLLSSPMSCHPLCMPFVWGFKRSTLQGSALAVCPPRFGRNHPKTVSGESCCTWQPDPRRPWTSAFSSPQPRCFPLTYQCTSSESFLIGYHVICRVTLLTLPRKVQEKKQSQEWGTWVFQGPNQDSGHFGHDQISGVSLCTCQHVIVLAGQ